MVPVMASRVKRRLQYGHQVAGSVGFRAARHVRETGGV
jgi:hypothetical protein